MPTATAKSTKLPVPTMKTKMDKFAAKKSPSKALPKKAASKKPMKVVNKVAAKAPAKKAAKKK